jgi:four helix bundle protein
MRKYSFEKLDVWQLSRALTKEIYLVTREFPADEKYGIINQLRRASISICSNIAEGSARTQKKDKARFIEIAFGSLMEVLNQLIISKDLSFLSEYEFENLRPKIEQIGNMLNSLRKSILA